MKLVFLLQGPKSDGLGRAGLGWAGVDSEESISCG